MTVIILLTADVHVHSYGAIRHLAQPDQVLHPNAVEPTTSMVRQPNRRQISTSSPVSAFCPNTATSCWALQDMSSAMPG